MPHSAPHDDQPVDTGFGTPHFSGSAEQLTYRCATLVARKAFECFGGRIKTVDGMGGEIGNPHLVIVVDINCVAAALALRQAPDLPGLVHRIISTDFAAVPETHPQKALGIRPDPPWPDPGPGRLHHQSVAAHGIDRGDVIACKRRVPNLSARCRGDPIRAESLRRLPCLNLAGGGIDAAVNATLTGKP